MGHEAPEIRQRGPQGALFKTELRYLVDERHPQVKLAGEVDWSQFEESFGQA